MISEEPSPASLGTQLQAEQVRIAVEQVHRIPPAHLLVDIGLSYTAWKSGLGNLAWVWLVTMTVCQVGRAYYTVRLHASTRLSNDQMLTRMSLLLTALGSVHALLMVLVFTQPLQIPHYVLTMIYVGNAAGAVSPVAGHLRSYVSWASIYGGTLAACWLSQGTVEGVGITVLIGALFVILSLYVRDQGQALLKLVTMTDSFRRERDRAERANLAKTRFFAAASHDLRQPLTALAYNAATVQALAQVTGDQTLARVGQGIARALNESRGLLDSLLEVSELDAGAVHVNWQAVDVQALLHAVGDNLRPVAEARGLTLSVQTEPTLPQAWSDEALLRRVINNLVGNAIKFTAVGEITLQARLVNAGSAPHLALTVADTGPGIPASAQGQVFEEFFQVGNAERDRSRGLGLGLSIVRRLVQLLEGEVSLQSELGRGSRFEVVLPCGQQIVAKPADQRPAATATACRPAHGARSVLVVDDEAEIREALTTLFVTVGWVVRTAGDAQCALAALGEGFRPDALVLDFRLREGLSGLDLLRQLRQQGCGAPALLVTGDTAPERILAAREAGVAVLYKPIDGMSLLASMNELVEGAASQGQTS